MKALVNSKKVFAFVVSFLMVAALVPGEARASAEIVGSGQIGDNVYWTLDADGVLTVSGTGSTRDDLDPIHAFEGREWDSVY